MRIQALSRFDPGGAPRSLHMPDLTRHGLRELRELINGLLNSGGGYILVGVQKDMLVTGVRTSPRQLRELQYAIMVYAQNQWPKIASASIAVRFFEVVTKAEVPSTGFPDSIVVQISVNAPETARVVFTTPAGAEAYVCAAHGANRLSAPQILERALCASQESLSAAVQRQSAVHLLQQQKSVLDDVVKACEAQAGQRARIVVVEGAAGTGKALVGRIAFQRLQYELKVDVDMAMASPADVYLRIIQTLYPDVKTRVVAVAGEAALRNVSFNLLNHSEEPVLIFLNGASEALQEIIDTDAPVTYLITTRNTLRLGLERLNGAHIQVFDVAPMAEEQVADVLEKAGMGAVDASTAAQEALTGSMPPLREILGGVCLRGCSQPQHEYCTKPESPEPASHSTMDDRITNALLNTMRAIGTRVSLRYVCALVKELGGDSLIPLGRLLACSDIIEVGSGYEFQARGFCEAEQQKAAVKTAIRGFVAMVKDVFEAYRAMVFTRDVLQHGDDVVGEEGASQHKQVEPAFMKRQKASKREKRNKHKGRNDMNDESAQEHGENEWTKGYVIKISDQTQIDTNGFQVMWLREMARTQRDFLTANKDAAMFIAAAVAAGDAEDLANEAMTVLSTAGFPLHTD